MNILNPNEFLMLYNSYPFKEVTADDFIETYQRYLKSQKEYRECFQTYQKFLQDNKKLLELMGITNVLELFSLYAEHFFESKYYNIKVKENCDIFTGTNPEIAQIMGSFGFNRLAVCRHRNMLFYDVANTMNLPVYVLLNDKHLFNGAAIGDTKLVLDPINGLYGFYQNPKKQQVYNAKYNNKPSYIDVVSYIEEEKLYTYFNQKDVQEFLATYSQDNNINYQEISAYVNSQVQKYKKDIKTFYHLHKKDYQTMSTNYAILSGYSSSKRRILTK